MDLGLHERVCIVTGSTGGIGLVTARLLAEEGARVVTCGRRRAPGVGEAAHVQLDLREPAAGERLSDEARALGAIHALVNNAGAAYQAGFEELRDDDWN